MMLGPGIHGWKKKDIVSAFTDYLAYSKGWQTLAQSQIWAIACFLNKVFSYVDPPVPSPTLCDSGVSGPAVVSQSQGVGTWPGLATQHVLIQASTDWVRDGQGTQAGLVSLNFMVFAETKKEACSFTRLRGVRVWVWSTSHHKIEGICLKANATQRRGGEGRRKRIWDILLRRAFEY